MLMKDRVVLVTGASRGIGAATAKTLAKHGASVGVNYFQSETAARTVVDEIASAGGRAVALKGDVREQPQVENMVKHLEESYGPVGTLVSNASITFPVKPFLDYPWDAFKAKLVGEIKASFNCCRAVAPGMIRRGKGCIIAISSGLSRHPGEGFCAHSTAKSGLDGLMKSLALELGPKGIRVNVVAPGLILTDATASQPQARKDAVARMTPLRRNGLAEDVAGAVLMLASDEACFVSGAYLPVSGGIQMI